jgi:3-oxoacyl-[acyl-carrier protein] reductase
MLRASEVNRPRSSQEAEEATYADLARKVAVVTGGSRGIGAATARMLASSGARVVLASRGAAALEAVAASIRDAGADAVAISADLTAWDAARELRERTESEVGPVEILAAFAGGSQGRPAPAHEVSKAEWRAVVDGNLTSTFLTLKAFLPGMIGGRRGSIITIASTAARIPTPAPASYAAAKAAIVMLTRQVANEVARHGVRVNCLAPSTIRTERLAEQASEQQLEAIAEQHPLGRLGEPEDVARAALFLASDASSWLTGITLDVAGGKVML